LRGLDPRCRYDQLAAAGRIGPGFQRLLDLPANPLSNLESLRFPAFESLRRVGLAEEEERLICLMTHQSSNWRCAGISGMPPRWVRPGQSLGGLGQLGGPVPSGWKHCLGAALAENFAPGIECLHRPAIVVALAVRWARAFIGDGAAVHHISGIRDG